MYKLFFKRFFDFAISLIGLILLSPILIFVAIGLYFANGENGVIFFQDRPGKNAKIFRIIKFKTMNDKLNDQGILLSDEERLTKIGKMIRSTSIDELPQLLNVLKGDMSFVGPRPLLKNYLPLYSNVQERRHDVRPGITGWAQVNGRNAISWSQKFDFDVWYVDNENFWLDFKIVILTIKKVLIREGINSNSSVIMEPFNGNN